MLTEQRPCKNLDGLSIICPTGWGRAGARAASLSVIQDLIINFCPAVKPTAERGGKYLHLRPLREKQSAALCGDMKKISMLHQRNRIRFLQVSLQQKHLVGQKLGTCEYSVMD